MRKRKSGVSCSAKNIRSAEFGLKFNVKGLRFQLVRGACICSSVPLDACLGWLIDSLEQRVYVYRPGQAVELFDGPATVSGDPVLSGFILPVRELW